MNFLKIVILLLIIDVLIMVLLSLRATIYSIKLLNKFDINYPEKKNVFPYHPFRLNLNTIMSLYKYWDIQDTQILKWKEKAKTSCTFVLLGIAAAFFIVVAYIFIN